MDEEKVKQVMMSVAMAMVNTDGYSLTIERDTPRMVELNGFNQILPEKQRVRCVLTLVYNEEVNFEI